MTELRELEAELNIKEDYENASNGLTRRRYVDMAMFIRHIVEAEEMTDPAILVDLASSARDQFEFLFEE